MRKIMTDVIDAIQKINLLRKKIAKRGIKLSAKNTKIMKETGRK